MRYLDVAAELRSEIGSRPRSVRYRARPSWGSATVSPGSPCAGRSSSCATRASSRAGAAPAGSSLVGSDPPAPRPGHHHRGRARGRGRRARPARARVRVRRRRPTRSRRTSASPPTPRCCASCGSTSPTTSRSPWSRCGSRAALGAVVSRGRRRARHVLRPAAAPRRRARPVVPDHHRRDRGRPRRARAGCAATWGTPSWPAGGSPTIAPASRSWCPSTAIPPDRPHSKSNSP